MAQHSADPAIILVTGGTGFVGANIVLHLAQYGHHVVVYDMVEPAPIVEHFWEEVRHRIIYEFGDVTDASRLSDVVERHNPDAVVHAAVITAVDPRTEADLAARVVDVNVIGTLRALEATRHPSVRRMIYVSSSGIYGFTDPHVPIPESASLPYQGQGLYTITKDTSERLCFRYRELFDLDVIVGRLGGPYGPMERDSKVRPIMSPIYQLARAALTQEIVRLYANDESYDWTYTMDHALSIRLLLEAPALSHSVYNLSNGTPRRLSEVTAALTELIPESRFEWVDTPELADLSLDIPPRGPLDITRLREDVGFKPVYDLESGLEAALPWWRRMVEGTDRDGEKGSKEKRP